MDKPSLWQDYWLLSRSHSYSLALALPLLLLYESLLLVVNRLRPQSQQVANFAELVFRRWLGVLGGGGTAVFLAALLVPGLLLILRERGRRPELVAAGFQPWVLVLMLAESAVWAYVLGRVVGQVTARITGNPGAGPVRALLSQSAQGLSRGEGLVMSLGAGLFEELLFRVVLVSGLSAGLVALQRSALGAEFMTALGLGGPLRATLLAAVLSALSFSLMHYMGGMADRFTVSSFVFRFLAGLAFTAVYLLRGFGIVIWAHALYDIGVYLLAAPDG